MVVGSQHTGLAAFGRSWGQELWLEHAKLRAGTTQI